MEVASIFVCSSKRYHWNSVIHIVYTIFKSPHSISLKVLFCSTSTLPRYMSSGYESASLLQTLDIRSHYWELASIEFHRAVPQREHASAVLVGGHSTAFTFLTTSTISLDSSLLYKFFFLQLSTTSSFLYCRASRVILLPDPVPLSSRTWMWCLYQLEIHQW